MDTNNKPHPTIHGWEGFNYFQQKVSPAGGDLEGVVLTSLHNPSAQNPLINIILNL